MTLNLQRISDIDQINANTEAKPSEKRVRHRSGLNLSRESWIGLTEMILSLRKNGRHLRIRSSRR